MKKKQTKEWQVEWLPIDGLKPYENNPREIEAAIPLVAASIRRFGFRVPLVIGNDGEIAAGHTRLAAAKSLGMEKVPCVRADDLTKKELAAFRLADNKVSEASSWDFGKLDLEIESLGGDFDMGDFGFEDIDVGNADALAKGMDDDNPQTGDKEDDYDDVGRLTVEIPRKYYGRAAKWFRKGGKDEAAQFILVAAGCVNNDGDDETTDHEDDGDGDD